MITHPHPVAWLALSLSLVACGGSGGGSADGATNASASGATVQAPLVDDGSTSSGPSSPAAPVVMPPASMDERPVEPSEPNATVLSEASHDAVLRQVFEVFSGRAYDRRLVAFPYETGPAEPCATGEVARTDGDGRNPTDWRYAACRIDGDVVDGNLRRATTANGLERIATSLSVAFEPEGAMRVDGTVRRTHRGPVVGFETFDLDYAFRYPGGTLIVDGASTYLQASTDAIAFGGAFAMQAPASGGSRIDVAAAVPFVAGDDGLGFVDGRLELVAEDGSTMTVAADSGDPATARLTFGTGESLSVAWSTWGDVLSPDTGVPLVDPRAGRDWIDAEGAVRRALSLRDDTFGLLLALANDRPETFVDEVDALAAIVIASDIDGEETLAPGSFEAGRVLRVTAETSRVAYACDAGGTLTIETGSANASDVNSSDLTDLRARTFDACAITVAEGGALAAGTWRLAGGVDLRETTFSSRATLADRPMRFERYAVERPDGSVSELDGSVSRQLFQDGSTVRRTRFADIRRLEERVNGVMALRIDEALVTRSTGTAGSGAVRTFTLTLGGTLSGALVADAPVRVDTLEPFVKDDDNTGGRFDFEPSPFRGTLTLVDATGVEVTLSAVPDGETERRVDRVLRDAAGETILSDTVAFPSFAPEDLPVVP